MATTEPYTSKLSVRHASRGITAQAGRWITEGLILTHQDASVSGKPQLYPTFVDLSVRTSNDPTNKPRPLAVVVEMFGCSVTSLIRLQIASSSY